jgi:hypothetical protein
MIASLVIVFPTTHEGGSLVLRHNEKEFIYDSGSQLSGPSSKIGYVAFFSDTDHEVTEVTSGHRVTFTYNLYGGKSAKIPKPNPSLQADHARLDEGIASVLKALLDKPDISSKYRLAFGLQHGYVFTVGTSIDDTIFGVYLFSIPCIH